MNVLNREFARGALSSSKDGRALVLHRAVRALLLLLGLLTCIAVVPHFWTCMHVNSRLGWAMVLRRAIRALLHVAARQHALLLHVPQ